MGRAHKVELPTGFRLQVEPRGTGVLLLLEDQALAAESATRSFGLVARTLSAEDAAVPERVDAVLAELAAQAWARHDARRQYQERTRLATRIARTLRSRIAVIRRRG